jgi:hypothetical protein
MASDDVIVALTRQVTALVAEVKMIREHLEQEETNGAEEPTKSRTVRRHKPNRG